MKALKVGLFILLVSAIAVGCSKKKEEVAGLSGLGMGGEDKDVITQTITTPETTEPPVATQAQPVVVSPTAAQPQPIQTQAPAAAAKSTAARERNKQIQTALKNAGLYMGEIDGKRGVLTRKAIEEFQQNNGLNVDGKVGPNTWAALQKYLNVKKTKQ